MANEATSTGVGRRARVASKCTFTYHIDSAWVQDWLDELPYYTDLDDHREVTSGFGDWAWMEPETSPMPWTPTPSTRSGTCFDVESTEMRAACVPTIREYLDGDIVLHEVRHQRAGYHTDLVFADIDSDGLRQRTEIVVGDDPIHDPLQRFRVWWHLKERGPKPRAEAEENGRYADPSKNRKHLDWLLDHGYAAPTNAGAVTAVTPPSICTLHAVELKLRDWETALEQAARARRAEVEEWRSQHWEDRYGYADYAWVALDAGAIGPALEHEEEFRDAGVGLLAVAEGGTVVEHIDAEHRPRGRYTRDRAYAESQVWHRADHDEYVPPAEDESPVEDTKQQTLVTDGGVEQDCGTYCIIGTRPSPMLSTEIAAESPPTAIPTPISTVHLGCWTGISNAIRNRTTASDNGDKPSKSCSTIGIMRNRTTRQQNTDCFQSGDADGD